MSMVRIKTKQIYQNVYQFYLKMLDIQVFFILYFEIFCIFPNV